MSYNLNQIDPEERIGLYAEPREEVPEAGPRRVLTAGIALLVMALFAGGLWFAYVEGLHHAATPGGDDIPLIRADSQPIKIRPTNPGGMAIPDRNMLFYNETRPAVEHLLPPPEQPMARPAAPPAAAPAASVTLAASPPAAATAPAAPVGPTGTIAAGGATVASPASAGPGSRERPGAPERQAERSTTAGPTTAGPATPRHAPHDMARPGTAPASLGGIRLQLGSVRNAAIARQEWERIRRDNADLLGSLSAFAIRADLGEKGVYYRIETGPVGDVARADQLCSKLRQRHLGCIIVR